MRAVNSIASMTSDGIIGRATNDTFGFPDAWDYPEDLLRFKELTQRQGVLMGRKTFFSIPKENRPLKNRFNIVASRQEKKLFSAENYLQVLDAEKFVVDFLESKIDLGFDTLWVIGGREIYQATLHLCNNLFLTVVKGKHDGNVYFPDFKDLFVEDFSARIQSDSCTYHIYRSKNLA
ncbi:MAG: dihydrofolate reductase [Bdellovibrionales bacterium]|nr:dihydrofolate reductase [Bdellovibrionales bacterium]